CPVGCGFLPVLRECTACPESAFTIAGIGVHLGRNTQLLGGPDRKLTAIDAPAHHRVAKMWLDRFDFQDGASEVANASRVVPWCHDRYTCGYTGGVIRPRCE